jgi:hypothetical protein
LLAKRFGGDKLLSMDGSPPALPAWVRKRDGGTQPFDADKINRALFAATEALGRPDAFVARELTDSVLHFLGAETENGIVASEQIAEVLAKVVRELGQPQLAEVFLELRARRALEQPASAAPPRPRHLPPHDRIAEHLAADRAPVRLQRALAGSVLADFSLERVYSRNLVAAHEEGLLVLCDLETPAELAGAVLRPPVPAGGPSGAGSIFEALESARQYVGRTLAFDAPERELAQRGVRIGDTMAWMREICRAARTLGLEIVFNLGCEAAPPWAAETATGPLFADQSRQENTQSILGQLDVITDHVLQQGPRSPLRIDWHLSARDFEEELHQRRLQRLVRAVLGGTPITFVCDRPRREVSLAEGLDRNHQGVLQWVGLNLPVLLRRQERSLTQDQFLGKVMSLARLAASAGVQKREFLRRHGRPERPAFLLDRAHTVLFFIGLHEVAQRVLQSDPSNSAIFTPFATDLIRKLEATLAQEARLIHMQCLVDDPPLRAGARHEPSALPTDVKTVLKASSRWHGTCGRGTARFVLPLDRAVDPAELIELLQHAWKQTALNRIGFEMQAATQAQLGADW